MTFNQYQELAHATAVYPHKDATQTISYVALGLAGEAGEVANQIKKVIRDDGGQLTPERHKKLVAELGDCLWYMAELCTVLDIATSMDYIAIGNLEKLRQRKEENKLHGDQR